MKKNFEKFLLLAFFALFALNSCQDEITDITQPDEEQVIVAQSPLVTMMRTASKNNGTLDNILDDANCMSINLPVTIVVNTITITINTLEDLELIVDIFEEFSDDDDDIEFIFPITIILNDHSEILIEDEDQLSSFIESCEQDDDHNECIEFNYPISFSILNAEFLLINTITIDNDRQLYHFLDRIDDVDEAIIASLNFPVEMIYTNGETVVVHDNQELSRVIIEADGICDDDDEDDCDIEDVDEYLMECHWNIHHYNDDDNYRPLSMTFMEDGGLSIISQLATVAITGNWSTAETDAGIILSITELSQYGEALGGDWLIVECDDDRFKLVRIITGGENTRMLIKRRCGDEPDCGPQEIRMNLVECHWYAGSNINDNNQLGAFYFRTDGTLVVVNPSTNVEVTGAWNVALTDYGIKLILDLPEPYNMLARYWRVVECDDDRIKVVHEDYYIVFERECIDPFECFSGREYGICDDGNEFDGLGTFNLEDIYADCLQDHVEISFHSTQSAAANGVEALESIFTNTTNSQTIYARVGLVDYPDQYEIYPVALFVEDCDETCTEADVDSFLMEAECHWIPVVINGSDDFNTYDFYFNDNQDLKIIDGDGAETFGVWTTSGSSNDGVTLSISQIEGTLQAFNGDWSVEECGELRMVVTNDNIDLILERECQ